MVLSNYLTAIGRYMMAALFLVRGAHKFFNPSETQNLIASARSPDDASVYWSGPPQHYGRALMLECVRKSMPSGLPRRCEAVFR